MLERFHSVCDALVSSKTFGVAPRLCAAESLEHQAWPVCIVCGNEVCEVHQYPESAVSPDVCICVACAARPALEDVK